MKWLRWPPIRGRWHPDYELAGGWLHAVNLLVLGHHVASVAAGLVGLFIEPSPGVIRVLGGNLAVYLWSSLLVAAGASAIAARLFRKVRAEMVALVVLGIARVLWMAMLMIGAYLTGEPAALQSGIALGGGGLFMLAWAIYAGYWVQTGRMAVAVARDDGLALQHLTTELARIVDKQSQEGR